MLNLNSVATKGLEDHMGGSPFSALKRALLGIVGGVGRHHRGHPGGERRSEPRLRVDDTLSTEEGLSLVVGEGRYAVFDLSTRGLCFRAGENVSAFEVGDSVNGSVDFRTLQIPLGLEVVNRRGSYVGCKIVDAPMLWITEVAKVIDPARIGAQLHEVDPDVQSVDAEVDDKLRWFAGGPACDLLVWYGNDGAIDRAQMFFMGQVVEWSAQHGLRSGRVDRPPHAEPGHGLTHPEIRDLQVPGHRDALAFASHVASASSIDEGIRSLFAPHDGETP